MTCKDCIKFKECCTENGNTHFYSTTAGCALGDVENKCKDFEKGITMSAAESSEYHKLQEELKYSKRKISELMEEIERLRHQNNIQEAQLYIVELIFKGGN